MKLLGKVGNGNIVHVVFPSVDQYGQSYVHVVCGADHATNRAATRTRALGGVNRGFDFNKVTCKKCLKIHKEEL